MKVIILFSESLHYGLAAASRVLAYAKGLKDSGADVEIVMPYSFVKNNFKSFEQKGQLNSVNYRYLNFSSSNPFEKYPKGISHAIAFFKASSSYFLFICYLIQNSKKYDILFIYYFGNLFTFILLLINRHKIRVSDLCEIPYHDHRGRRKLVNRWIREKYVFPLFDAFVVISENLQTYITDKIKLKVDIVKIPILYLPGKPFVSKTIPAIPYFIHSGSLTESKDGILGILEAFGKAKTDLNIVFHFYITGYLTNSPEKNNILSIIEKYHLKYDVFFKGFISKEDLHSLQLGASVAIINKSDSEMNHYNFPTKLSDYLSNQIAVIASEIGELTLYLRNNVNVYFYKPNDMNGLVNCIKDAMLNVQKRDQIAINGRKVAENNFSIEVQGKRLYVFFEELIKKRN